MGRIRNIKIFWVLIDATVHQWINELPRLTDEIYESMKHIAEFELEMHHVYIRAQKDPAQAWTSLQFIAINDVIDGIVDTWLAAWHGTLAVELTRLSFRNKRRKPSVPHNKSRMNSFPHKLK